MHARISLILDGRYNKTLILDDATRLVVPRAREVAAGDELLVDGTRYVRETAGGNVTISPPFREEFFCSLGDSPIRIRITEPMSKGDHEAVRFLEQFHYRRSLPFGRRGVLIAIALVDGARPRYVGLLELASAPLCNKARDGALNAPFQDGDVQWTAWNFQTRGKNAIRVANISRVVVHPDFRGLGLSTSLLTCAKRFSRGYWQLRGQRPLFLEIVADMLKFHPFPRSAGFRFVGYTEGNLSRLAKDMRYYLREEVPEVDMWDVKGVLRMQRKYAKTLRSRVKVRGLTAEEALDTLRSMNASTVLTHLDLVQGIARLPKPVYMAGLTEGADRFLLARTRGAEPSEEAPSGFDLSGSIGFEDVMAAVRPPIPRSKRGKEVRLAFDYDPKVQESLLFRLTATIPMPSKVLITGFSGSGKTTLLQLIARRFRPASGRVSLPPGAIVAMPTERFPDKPLIECFGGTAKEAISILNSVGLSEPRLYLSTYSNLSEGERERSRIGTLLASNASVWLIDEFGAHLDETTLRILSIMLRRLAARTRATVIVSSNRPKEVRACFCPDIEIQLELGREAALVVRSAEPPTKRNLELLDEATTYALTGEAGVLSLAHG